MSIRSNPRRRGQLTEEETPSARRGRIGVMPIQAGRTAAGLAQVTVIPLQFWCRWLQRHVRPQTRNTQAVQKMVIKLGASRPGGVNLLRQMEHRRIQVTAVKMGHGPMWGMLEGRS